MKKILKSLLAVGVLFTAMSCSKDQTSTLFDPSSESESAAYFAQKSVSEEFVNTATGDQKLLIDIYRQNNKGDVTMGIDCLIPSDAEGIYSIPDHISFKDGDYKAILEIIAHEVESFAKGATYSAKIAIGDSHSFKDIPTANMKLDKSFRDKKAPATRGIQVTQYTEITIATSLALDWQPAYIPKDFANVVKEKPAGTEDKDWYVLDEGGKPIAQTTEWEVGVNMESGLEDLVVQRAVGTSVFRILNTGEGGANIIFSVDLDESHKLTIDGEKYFRCVMTEQDTKIDMGDTGFLKMIDLASYFGDDRAYATYPCYWDGGNKFHFTLYWIDLINAYNNPGAGISDTFIFNTGADAPAEPEVEISYLGAQTSSTGIKTHPIEFEPNADVDYYYATVIKEDLGAIEDKVALAARLAEIQEAMEAEEYKGDFARIRFEAMAKEVWNLGAEEASYTALSLSVSKDGKVKVLDYTPFTYNPMGDAEKVEYAFLCGAGGFGEKDDYTDYSIGYFGDNSVMIYCDGVEIVGMKYALISVADFNAAGLDTADDAAKIEYLDKNGRSANADMLKDINGETEKYTNYVYIDAKPATEYKVLASVSNPDATAVVVQDVKTEDAMAGDLSLSASLAENIQGGKYKHTNVLASFKGSHIVGGKYMILSTDAGSKEKPTTFGKLFEIKDGKLQLKEEAADKDVLDLIDSKGKAFSSGADVPYDQSALWLMNTEATYNQFLDAAPAMEYAVLAFADHDGSGGKSWKSSIIKTEYAPDVSFEQKIRIDGKNLRFTWVGGNTARIFEIEKVLYALVPKSELASAGVDASMISDDKLNNFDARRAAPGADKAAIDAQEANAKKVLAILSAKGKTFKADAASLINQPSGVSKQFENLAAGDYALIAYANDKYNTKLTIGEAKIQ